MRAFGLLMIALALGPVLAPGSADADTASAERLYREALGHYTRAEFEEAVQLLERASRETRESRLLARVHLYLGINLAVLGQDAAARRHFRVALGHDPELRVDDSELKASIVRLFAAARDELRGELLVRSDLAGAQAFVDGRPLGKLPARALLAVGAHRLEVLSPDGKRRRELRVVVNADRTEEVTVALLEGVTTLPLAAPARGRPRPWTWIAAGGSLASLVAAVGLGSSALIDHREYEAPATTHQRGTELADGIRTKSLAANVLFGAAGALAITSVVLFFLEGRGRAAEAAPPALRAGVNGASVFVEGRF